MYGDDEPDFVECTRCGENMGPIIANYEAASWVVGYRCGNCHSLENSQVIDPLAVLIKQSEELWREFQNRRNI